MNEIRRDLHLAAPVQRVWAFLTDPQKLSMWLMDSNLSPTPGTNFKFTSPPAGQWDGKIYCEIQEIIEYERISYTWSANDIGATTLVTETYSPAEKAKTQAANDFLVFGSVACAALLSGVLHEWIGWRVMNYAALPFVAVVLLALFAMLRLRRRAAALAD